MSSRFGFHTNHFGISEEELDYDENDPSWFDTSPGANVFYDRYESAKPFVEKLQRQQRVFLEEKLEERRELRQAIRERVSHNFDERLKQHMAKFQPKPRERLILDLFLSQQKKELEESFRERLNTSHDPESKSILGALKDSSSFISHHSVSKPAVPVESTSIKSKSRLPTDASTSVYFSKSTAVIDIGTSDMSSTSSSVTVTNLIPTLSAVPSVVNRITPKTTSSFPAYVTSACATPKIQQHSDNSAAFVFCPQKASTPISSSETFKSGHAALTRTDSISSRRSSASRSTSWPLQQIAEEQREFFEAPNCFIDPGILTLEFWNDLILFCSAQSNEASTIVAAKQNDSITQSLSKVKSLTVSSGTFDDLNTKSPNHSHQIYGHEIAFARTFMVNVADVPDSIKNELKCTIKEKISVSTKKFAKRNDIAQIVRFFNNLLNGLTVYGFNDKMINLKDDELARDWAMVHIIDTYLDLIPQDISLLKVVAAVLSSLTLSSIAFSKLLYGKLFIASPLLACILDLKKRSERFAETIVAWRSREIAIINLFIALKMSSASVDLQTTPESNGLGLMWKIIAVTVADSSAFGATLVTEILKVQHWNVMHKVYGRQMEKLVILIDKSVLPQWRASIQKIVPDSSEMNKAIQNVTENYLTALKFTVDDCLSSFLIEIRKKKAYFER
uniref:Nucleoporin GLE1 n=1 Tax=Wuchereria bancrofti TaxID=6293 RepID=A0A1I8EYM2_WUCBA